MDWFEKLTGFRETTYEETRAKLIIDGDRLCSQVNGKSYLVGHLEVVSLAQLRHAVNLANMASGRSKVSAIAGDVRELHRDVAYTGALFQVASQFNFLEMVSPNVTPEDGVTRYEFDRTQGPACAIAAGAATIYRNYFAPVGNGVGQTKDRQIDALADLGVALSKRLGVPVDALWTMRNGYALCTRTGLTKIADCLDRLDAGQVDELRGHLKIGIHWNVEVTDHSVQGRTVSQAFCSALPVSYTKIPARHWKPFATLVLEAAYEATLLVAAFNAKRGASNIVLLTQLGGGAFGNSHDWINSAIRRALHTASSRGLDVRMVVRDKPTDGLLELMRRFGRDSGLAVTPRT